MPTNLDTVDWAHPSQADGLKDWAGKAAGDIWSKAQSMTASDWAVVGAVGIAAAGGVGLAGWAALRATGIIGRVAAAASETSVGTACFAATEEMASALTAGVSDTRAAIANPLEITDPKLAQLFSGDKVLNAKETSTLATFDPFRMPLRVANLESTVGQYQATRLDVYQKLSRTASMGLDKYRRGIAMEAKVGSVDEHTQIARIRTDEGMRDIVMRSDTNMAFEQVAKRLPNNQFERTETRMFSFADRDVRTWADTDRGTLSSTVSGTGSLSGRLLPERDAIAELVPINKALTFSADGKRIIDLFGKLSDV
jgi:hypothetical protein